MALQDDRHLNGVYVVSKQYELIYANEELKKLFPQLKKGEYCYKAFLARREPCKTCPILRLEEFEEDRQTITVYIKTLRKTLETTAVKMEWPGKGESYLITFAEIYKKQEDTSYNAVMGQMYDELFSLNLTKNTYEIVFHEEGKYVIPNEAGVLDEMVIDVSEHMIHPDDKERFLEFWNLDRIRSGLSKNTSSISGEFRKLLKSGDYCWVSQIVVPSEGKKSGDQVLLCFISDIQERKSKEMHQLEYNIKNLSERNPLTGLYNSMAFYHKCREYLDSHSKGDFCIAYFDAEHFKLYNDWYGYEKGDEQLIKIARRLEQFIAKRDGLAGNLGEDDFVLLFRREKMTRDELQAAINKSLAEFLRETNILLSAGLYEIHDPSMPLSKICDYASIAANSVKGNYIVRCAWYDNQMKEDMEEEQTLFRDVKKGLEDDEFVVFVQPKCNLNTGKIVGLEALIRWNHPEKGWISPGAFVPLLEKNGYITYLDQYVWRKTCEYIREAKKKGKKPIPVSVNVSRVDLYNEELPDMLINLVDEYQIEPELLELEITESAYMANFDQLISVVKELRERDFVVLMDDFGSGYSSLNMLKNVDVDILKIDMKFLDMSKEDPTKSGSILEAIVRMAKWLDYRVIAEGVETKDQVDFLLSIGCNYSQGYYFYRPMSWEIFEERLFDESIIDYTGILKAQSKMISFKDVLSNNILSDVMFNNLLGGMAIYEVSDNEFRLLRVNEVYCKIMRCKESELDGIRSDIFSLIYEEDCQNVMEIFQNARKASLTGASGEFRRYLQDGDFIWVHINVFFLREHDQKRLYCASITDITDQKQSEKVLRLSQKKLEEILQLGIDTGSLAHLSKSNQVAAVELMSQIIPGGYFQCMNNDDCDFIYISNDLLNMIGLQQNDVKEQYENKMINLIHPEDRERVRIGVQNLESSRMYTEQFRLMIENRTIWVTEQSKLIEENGISCFYGVLQDITELVELRRQLEMVIENTPGDVFRVCNKEMQLYSYNLYVSLGYTKEEYKQLLDDHKSEILSSQEDQERVKRAFYEARKSGSSVDCTVKFRRRDQSKCWIQIKAICSVEEKNGMVFYGIMSDVSDVVFLKHNSEQRLNTVIKQAGLDMWEYNPYKNVLHMFNITNDSLAGRNHISEFVYNFPESLIEGGNIHEDCVEELRNLCLELRSTKHFIHNRIAFVTDDKATVWVEITGETVRDDMGKTLYCIGSARDITEQKRLERVVKTDSLTSLYNRATAQRMIESRLTNYSNASFKTGALFILDLDNFKLVNDRYGHICGDAVLAERAKQLRRLFRADDIVCRLGGDEFLIYCDLASVEDAEKKAKVICENMSKNSMDGIDINLTFSIGIAMFSDHGSTFHQLYENADVALYQAKNAGKNTYMVYDKSMPRARPHLHL